MQRKWLWVGMAIMLVAGCGKKSNKSEENAVQSELGEAPARVAERRPLVISAAGIRFNPPEAWDPARIDVVSQSGSEAATMHPDASFSVTFAYKAEQPAHDNSALLNLYVLPRAKWSDTGTMGVMIDSTGDWVFVADMPDANPYRAGLLDADQFEAMRLTLDEVREAFSIENGGPTDASLRAEKRK